MDKLDESRLYLAALGKWGKSLQIIKCIEECAELIHALTKWVVGKSDKARSCIIEELVDVEIMVSQLKMAFNCESEFDQVKQKKLERLEQMLAEDE